MKLTEKINTLIDPNVPLESNLANVACILYHDIPKTSWAGFYLIGKDDPDLYVHSYQGPLACMRIPFGHGVCGTSAKEKRSIMVPDVHEFPGHIPCSSLSRSELVIPILKDDNCVGVIDLDSDEYDGFTTETQEELESVAVLLSWLF